MNNYKQHISFKIFTLILVASLLLPSAVKLNHAFEDHKHEVCKTNSIDHFHELDLDCEFYKFNKTNQYFITFNHDISEFVNIDIKQNFSYYNFLNSHQPLNFSLRGPPQVSV